MGYVDFFTFLIPLYGLSLGLDAAQIGILVGARSILALFLSIHIGVLMDRFGTRAVTLVFVWIGMLLAPLFPLAPNFWALLLLQLISGAAVSFAWSGAQTLIAQIAEGDARYIGRFSFFARLGSTSAPIVAGAVWDFGGAWPSYLLGAAWGAVLTAALLRAPEAEIFPRNRLPAPTAGGSASATPGPARPTTQLDPLIAIPAVAVSMAVITMRNTTYSLQTSVYVVYLDQIALVGTTIGLLVRRLGDRQRVRLAVRRPRDAPRQPAAHDAERHRVLDPADRRDAAARRDLRAAGAVSARAGLARRGDPAGHPVGAGARRRPSPAGRGRRAAPDRPAAQLDPDPAGDGRRSPTGSARATVF